jgi:hypothetical protein
MLRDEKPSWHHFLFVLYHIMVFDPCFKSGELKRLGVDFGAYENELASVYGLYTV